MGRVRPAIHREISLNLNQHDVFGLIPAPPFDSLELGPLNFRLYGLCIALGVLAAVAIGQRRWRRWGGDPEDVITVAIWAVPAGLIGARLYHVITDWGDKYDEGRWVEAFKIWQGGLGIPGGVLIGAIVGIIVAKRLVPKPFLLADAIIVGLPVAQAIGRFGNYFNQELFGGPTDLPWGLEVDSLYRPAEYVDVAAFHPTFLYEGLWNLALAGLIVWGSSRMVFKPGRWFAVYVMGYGLGRLWVESIRIDEATLIAGIRVNIWMSIAIILAGLVWLLWGGGPLDKESTAKLKAGSTFPEIFGDQTLHYALAGGAGEETADAVAEGRPEPDSPVPEVPAGDDDTEESADGIDPEETA